MKQIMISAECWSGTKGRTAVDAHPIANDKKNELCYGVFEVLKRYLRFSLILIINFYHVINKLIILISGPY
jgi:hypothetical protein